MDDALEFLREEFLRERKDLGRKQFFLGEPPPLSSKGKESKAWDGGRLGIRMASSSDVSGVPGTQKHIMVMSEVDFIV